jgi:glycosyltransferase involved in cell wall biosynthesis
MLKSIGYAARNAIARIKRHYIDCVDIFACITDFQRQKLIEAGFPKEKLIVIPNSIDVPNKPHMGIVGDYVAYSGRISREKGVDLIIDAARLHPEIQFRFAGVVRDNELVDNLPANVKLMGYLSGDTLKQFYGDARFFVMASRWYEGFPMTILEAAQYSKPMIAPNHGGFTEIIGQGDNAIGLLTRPNDINSLDNAIQNLWNNIDLTRDLGLKAYNKLNTHYCSAVVAEQWQKLLNTICKI